jgi:TPR repeat protein
MIANINAVNAGDQLRAESSDDIVSAGIQCAKSGNYEKAGTLWKKAAENGDVDAQVLLGSLYADGKGVNKSYQEAFKWYYKAAKQGYSLGQYYVASCYNAGKGVDKNDSEAFLWYRLAAEQGNKEAQYNVGAAYYNGTGIEPDKIQAYAWIYSSLQNGFEFAKAYLEKIEKQLTLSEINKAKQLSQRILKAKIKAKD